jgi:hypothetical protein
MSSSGPLAGLPGARIDAGSGPVVATLLEGLLADAAALGPDPVGVASALAEHRAHRAAWYGDLVGPLLVPAAAASGLAGGLTDGDLGLRVALVTTGEADPVGALRDARAALEGSRAEVVGLHLPLPDGPPAAAASAALAGLESRVPVWLELPNRPGWQDALEVLASDGAECAAIRLDSPTGFGADAELAAVLRLAIDRDVTFAIAAAGLPVRREATAGLLNLVCAVRAALNGAEEDELVPVLAEPDAAPLCSALRRMSDADAAVSRAFLAGVTARVGATVHELERLGLIEPDAA